MVAKANRSRFLTLVRHAKSSWKDPALNDFDRPLNKRGASDAPLMGKRLASGGYWPDLIVASPARRARDTARLIAGELARGDEPQIFYDPTLYGADESELFEVARRFDDALFEIMLVGHNPGLTELANDLAACGIENIVTGGVVGLEFSVSSWRQITAQCGRMLFYDYPKRSINSR